MRKIYLLILVALLSLQAGAQSLIKFKYTQFNFGTVIDSNQTQVLSDSIYNPGSLTFSDTVYFYGRINSSNALLLGLADFTGVNALDTGETPFTGKAFSVPIPYSNPAFVSGPNGVIIWPVYRSGSADGSDTIRMNVTLTHPLGLKEAPLAKVYIIQRGRNLNINMGDDENLIQQVSLYDMSGRRMYSGAAQQSQSIAADGWSEGVYFCEITTYNGERRTIKFVLQ